MKLSALFISLCAVLQLRASDSTLKKVGPEAIRQDLLFMVRIMEEAHPNLYHRISREAFQKKLDSVLLTVRDSMTVIEAWPKFGVLAGSIDEGHTAVSWPDVFRRPEWLLFPVFVREFDGEAFVVRIDGSAEQRLKAGDRILSINGVPAPLLFTRLQAFAGGLPSWKNVVISSQFRYFLAATRMEGPYEMEVARGGQREKFTVQPRQAQHLRQVLAEYRKQTSSPAVPFSYRVLDQTTGYLNFRSMEGLSRFEQFADSLFTAIRQNGIQGLIIDLRENGGGSSALGDVLLSYLTGRRYRMSYGSRWKISQPYKDYYHKLEGEARHMRGTEMEDRYLKGLNSTLIQNTAKEMKPKARSNRFEGKVCFLIGPNTFSSANMLANAVKDYRLATLIGEPTGESPNDFGEVLTTLLPNMGMPFLTSTKQFIRANGDASDRDAILPDHFIIDDPLTPADECLEFALRWIAGRE